MRIRTIKPEFWRSYDITALPREVRLLFIGLWSYVDDNGVGVDDYRQIAADLFALEDDVQEVRNYVREGLATLSRVLLVSRYMIDNKPYLFINSWDRHQKIDRPGKARLPRPPDDWKPPTCENVSRNGSVPVNSRDPRESVSTVSLRARVAGTGEQGNRGTGEKNSELSLRASSGADAPRADDHDSDPVKIDARTVTAAWVDAVRANDTEPSKAQIGQVARAAKELLQTNQPTRVLDAARAAGTKGFVQIDRELTVMNGTPLSATPHRIPTTTARLRAIETLRRPEPGAAS